MKSQNLQYYFLVILLITALVITFYIFKPFLYVIMLAIVFAVIFKPIYQKILDLLPKYPSLSALFTSVIITIILLFPLTFLTTKIVQEAQSIYFSLAGSPNEISMLDVYENNLNTIKQNYPIFKDVPIDFNSYLEKALAWLIQNVGSVFSNILTLIVDIFIFILAFYYLLRDGKKLKKDLIFLSPLVDTDDEMIFKKLKTAINSVVKGSLIIAIIQGIIASIGFAIFGVPGAILWGTITSIASFIPGVGTSLIVIPAIIFLFLNGHILQAGGLLVWGVFAVGLIDNFLSPKLISHGTNLHPFLILLSVLGGLAFFGPIGFIVGPLSLSLLFALLDIYSYIIKSKKA